MTIAERLKKFHGKNFNNLLIEALQKALIVGEPDSEGYVLIKFIDNSYLLVNELEQFITIYEE